MTNKIMNQKIKLFSMAWIAAATTAVMPGAAMAAPQALPLKGACEALAGATFPAQVMALPSGPVRIETATLLAASAATVAERGPTPAARFNPALPQFCRVLGAIEPIDANAPLIQFQINLPMVWNGRSLQYGGGGFNGTLIDALSMVPAAPQ